MSALGHERTLQRGSGMSGLPPRTDIWVVIVASISACHGGHAIDLLVDSLGGAPRLDAMRCSASMEGGWTTVILGRTR